MAPEKCPKCGAETEEISNVFEFAKFFGDDDHLEKEWFCNTCSYNFNDDETTFWYDNRDLSKMKLDHIADIILSNWSDDINPQAMSYVDAMMNLDSIEDNFGAESGASIVSYFLASAQQWKGETARKVKKHLNKLVDDYYKSKK